MTVTQDVYTLVYTQHGTITIDHTITLGDFMIVVMICLLLVAFLIRWFISKVWE